MFCYHRLPLQPIRHDPPATTTHQPLSPHVAHLPSDMPSIMFWCARQCVFIRIHAIKVSIFFTVVCVRRGAAVWLPGCVAYWKKKPNVAFNCTAINTLSQIKRLGKQNNRKVLIMPFNSSTCSLFWRCRPTKFTVSPRLNIFGQSILPKNFCSLFLFLGK